MYRILSWGFILIGLLLLGWAAFDYYTFTDPAHVTIDEAERDLPDAPVGQPTDVVFTIHNPTWRTARVIGLAEC
jgi:hypothetical protein